MKFRFLKRWKFRRDRQTRDFAKVMDDYLVSCEAGYSLAFKRTEQMRSMLVILDHQLSTMSEALKVLQAERDGLVLQQTVRMSPQVEKEIAHLERLDLSKRQEQASLMKQEAMREKAIKGDRWIDENELKEIDRQCLSPEEGFKTSGIRGDSDQIILDEEIPEHMFSKRLTTEEQRNRDRRQDQ